MAKYKLAVVGGRDFDNKELLWGILDAAIANVSLIVSGGARGADSFAEQWADFNNIPKLIFKADWKQYGKAAGMIRNKDIVKEADRVLGFWDGSSNGTRDSLTFAEKLGKPLHIVYYKQLCPTLLSPSQAASQSPSNSAMAVLVPYSIYTSQRKDANPAQKNDFVPLI